MALPNNICIRFYRYLIERFPPKDFIPLSIVFAFTGGFAAQIYIGRDLHKISALLSGSLAFFLFLLRLRLFDEFKDFEHDVRYYPDRPVPRGLVTLKELTVLIFIVLGIEFFLAFLNGRLAMIFFLAAFSYSLLMFKEFFVNDWIRQHFSIYIVSHEILVFPLFFYLFVLNSMPPEHLGKMYFWFLAVFLGGQLFLLEVVRKIRPKELEVGSRDTYTAQYGIGGASALLVFLGLMIIGLDFYIGKTIYGKISMPQFLPLLAGLFFFYSVIRFSRWPSANSAKGAFNTVILFLLTTDAVLVTQFFIRRL